MAVQRQSIPSQNIFDAGNLLLRFLVEWGCIINDHDNLHTSISEGMLNCDLQMKFNDIDADDEDKNDIVDSDGSVAG